MTSNDSRVRDHLANERTFLAWVRTGIALLGFGFLVAKLRFELAPRTPGSLVGRATLGVLFVAAGMATVLFALVHYSSIRRSIDSGSFKPLTRGALLLVTLVSLVGLAVILNLVGAVRLPW